jgi:hypothetical protein
MNVDLNIYRYKLQTFWQFIANSHAVIHVKPVLGGVRCDEVYPLSLINRNS